MPVMKKLTVGGVTYDTVGEASVTQVQASGTKIATVSIDGTSTDIYAPSGGSSVEPATAAPLVDGTAAVGSSAKYAREDHVHPTDTSRQAALVSGTNIKTVNGNSLLGSGDLEISGGGGVSYTTQAVSIPTSAWSNNAATVNVSAVTSTSDVIVSPAPASAADWAGSGIYCTAQGSGTLTFACSTAPSAAISVNVMAFEGGESIQPSTYSVTIQLTNPSNSSAASTPACRIFEIDDMANFNWYGDHAEIGQINSPTGSATVSIPLSSDGFMVRFYGSYPVVNGAPTCSGGVSLADTGESEFLFQVTGDGSAIIDSVDYDD